MAHTTQLQQHHNNFDYDPAGMEFEMERHRKRRKKWEEEVVDIPLRRDPLEVFGSDIMLKILSYLDARSVALSLLVSRAWHAVSSTDRLWASKFSMAHTTQLQQYHNNFDYDPAGMEFEMERHRKRRKKWEEEVVDIPLRRDPLEVFGSDIMLKILSYLDARSVALSLLVSRAWHAVKGYLGTGTQLLVINALSLA
ncbi:hypothetical protein CFP56_001261 [Quercus suber]|uniref:F-box domain-containing protein n=1 Tax=Quercus suber TaxID=58331 RepID=A0AAW0IMM5_QUESU